MSARHLSLGDLMEPADHPDVTGRDSFGRGRLSAAATQAARDQTRLQASQQTIASEVIAFQVLQQRSQLASGAEIDPARVAASLSAREREVIGLVATGRSDGEIASELFISKKTASVHVANIKGKLGASSRVEIAMLAAKLKLVPGGATTIEQPRDGGGPGGSAVMCPFKGLASFDVGDGGYFFGRERVVAELVARLAATTFLAVVGPSGSGKSSVVRAGLVPALRAGVLPGSEGWRLAVLRPGDHPLAALGRAVRGAMRDAGPVDDEHPAEEWLDALPAGGRLVVVVDQFEEAYTVCRDPQERALFLGRLAALAGDAERRALVAIAVRSEFYGRLAEQREVAELASSSTVLLGPMAADELTRAIELPARAAGLRMDTSLVPALVADVLQQPGALPMLSSTLLELWQRRDGRSLRMETYRAIGGISGAVGRVAETVFGRLSPDDQVIARSIFLRLATVGDNGIASRRRVPVSEIDGGTSPDVARVMAALVDGRLLTVDDGAVEPAHEALLREWPRMRQWLDDDGQARRLREHLVRSAREWDEAGREPGELYRGQRLGAALEWASNRRGELNDVERAFLDSGRRASEAELAGQRRVNVRLRGLLGAVAALLVVALVAGTLALRQADTARGLADVARTAADEARTVAQDAGAAAAVARVRELAASSRVAIQNDPSLARLLAVAAAGLLPIDADVEARLRDAWRADVVVDRLPAAPGRPRGVFAHGDADGRRVAKVWGADGDGGRVLEVVDVASGATLWTHQFSDPGTAVDEARFSLDGSKVITGLFRVSEADRTAPPVNLGILVFDAATGAQVQRIDMGPCGTNVMGVSAAGYLARLAPVGASDCYGSEGPTYDFALVDPTTGKTRTVARRTTGDAMVSADGAVLAYSTPERIAVAKDLRTGKVRFRLDTTRFLQSGDQFRDINGDGSLVLFGNIPPIVIDTTTGAVIGALPGGQASQDLGMALGPDGDLAYTAGIDGVLRAWDARHATEVFALPGVPGGQVMPSRGDRVSVLDQTTGSITVAEPRTRGEAGDVPTCRGFFPAGQLAIVGTKAWAGATCDVGGDTLYGFDLAAHKVDWTGKSVTGQHIAVSSDGRLVAHQTSGSLGVEIDDATTGALIVRLEGTCTWDITSVDPVRAHTPGCKPFPTTPFPFWAQDLRFSPDGSVLVGLDDTGSIAVWDTVTGKLLRTIESQGYSADVMFTPDGRELLMGTGNNELLTYSTTTWQLMQGRTLDKSVETLLAPLGFVDGGRVLLATGGITADQSPGWIYRLDGTTFSVLGSRFVNTARLKAAAVSPDGKQIATASADGSVDVWDARTLELEHEMQVPDQAQGVAFVDDTHLAVMPQAGDLQIMILDRDELLAKVRSTLTRGFTAEECAQYGFGSACPTLDQMRNASTVAP